MKAFDVFPERARKTRMVKVLGSAALADLRLCGPGGLEVATLAAISRTAPQIVQMGHGDRGQTLVGRIPEDKVGALGELAGGRPGWLAMQPVEGDQGGNVVIGVVPGEGRGRRSTPIRQRAGLTPLGHQPSHPRTQRAGDLAQEGEQQATVGTSEGAKAETVPGARYPFALAGSGGAVNSTARLPSKKARTSSRVRSGSVLRDTSILQG